MNDDIKVSPAVFVYFIPLSYNTLQPSDLYLMDRMWIDRSSARGVRISACTCIRSRRTCPSQRSGRVSEFVYVWSERAG